MSLEGHVWALVRWGVGSVLALPLLLPASARGKTVVFPHALEVSGRITNTQNTFDTTLFVTYVGGLANGGGGGGGGGKVNVDLYVFDEATGLPMKSGTNAEIANPLSFTLDPTDRKRTVVLDDLITAAGGFGGTAVKQGYVVAVLDGDTSNVALQGFLANAHTSALNIDGALFRPQDVPAGSGTAQRTFVLPHVLETSGSVATSPNTFDTTVFMTYTGGQAGLSPDSSATANLFLYDQATGQPMTGGGGAAVCNPCTVSLGNGTRKVSFNLDTAIQNAGGFGGAVKQGFAVIGVSGADPANVNVTSAVSNSHSGPFDLAVFGFEPQPIQAAAAIADPDPANDPLKTFVVPHVLEKSGTVATTQNTFDTTLFMTYTGGLAGTPGASANVDVYLFDPSGAPLRSGTNLSVCNPCTVQLSDANRSQAVNVDNLITNAGGFGAQDVKLGFAVLRVTGDTDSVTLDGQLVNSHTGPFDVAGTEMPVQLVAGGGGGVGGAGGGGVVRKTFVIPHVLEVSGRISDTQNTFDTTLFATYTGGLFGGPAGDATLELSLYDDNGDPLTALGGGLVAAPLTFQLDAAHRSLELNFDDLITAAGGFDSSVVTGFGVITVTGDADNVNLQGFIVNAHTGPFDLAVFGFVPQEISSVALPEPSALALGAVAGVIFLALSRRRRRARPRG